MTVGSDFTWKKISLLVSVGGAVLEIILGRFHFGVH